MDYTDCLILKTLEKELNITATAHKLFITQPALTYRVKSLEKELGAELFVRTKKGVMLTGAGLVAAQYADKFIKNYEWLKESIASMQNDVRGSVNIVVSRAYTNILPRLLSGFCKKFPHVNISVKTDLSADCIEKVRKDEVHLALIRGKHSLNCEQILLSVDYMVVVSKGEINLKDLPNLPYIEYDTDTSLENDSVSI